MKPLRVTITATLVAVLLALFFFVPLPIARVRQTGLVEIEPQYVMPVYLHVQGRLEKVLIREGQQVKKGTILGEFSNLKMSSEEEEKRGDYVMKERRFAYYQHIAEVSSPEIEKARNHALSERDAAKAKWLYYRDHPLRHLVLRAPRAGTVIGVPRPEEIGNRFGIDPSGADSDQERPFCLIGDPDKLWIRMPVPPADYHLIRDDLARAKKAGGDLEVTLRVQGRDSHTWEGRIVHLPDAEAKEIPVQLSNKGGGPLAVKANSPPHHYIPQTQVYLVGVKILNPDAAICPGSLAQVKIHCEHRTGAWAVWRWINATLDLGLM
jgi:putative peptide zinc metalloprotease protein